MSLTACMVPTMEVTSVSQSAVAVASAACRRPRQDLQRRGLVHRRRRWVGSTLRGGQKQFEPLGGERVIDRSVDGRSGGLRRRGGGRAGRRRRATDDRRAGRRPRWWPAARPGPASVRAGLAAVPDGRDGGAGARRGPTARDSAELFQRVIDAVRAGAAAVVPAVAVVDTIRQRRRWGRRPRRAPSRADARRDSRAATLRAAHAAADDATDDAGLVEAPAAPSCWSTASATNLKLTDPVDRVVAEALLCPPGTLLRRWGRGPVPDSGARVSMRIGNGFDIHRFSAGPGAPAGARRGGDSRARSGWTATPTRT